MWFTTVLVSIIHLAIIYFIIDYLSRRVSNQPLGEFFKVGVVVKIIAGLYLGFVYKKYYGGADTFNYYGDAVRLSQYAWADPIGYFKAFVTNEYPSSIASSLVYINQERALLFSKIASLLAIISDNNYWLMSVYFSIFSFCGFWYLGSRIVMSYAETRIPVAVALLFFPSMVFWTSGLLKESLVMGAMCFCIPFALPYMSTAKKVSGHFIIFVPFLLLLVLKLKYYYIGVMMPIILAGILTNQIRKHWGESFRSWQTVMLWLMSFFTMIFLATYLHPNLRVDNFLNALFNTYDKMVVISDPDDLIDFTTHSNEMKTIVFNSPKALFLGVFGPLLFKADHFFHNIAVIENWLIFIFSVLALFRIKHFFKSAHKTMIISMLVYIGIMAVFMAISSPNYGTLSRYRVGYMPFFIFLILLDNPILQFIQGRFGIGGELKKK